MISREIEEALIARAKAGDRAAAGTLMTAHRGLVRLIARRAMRYMRGIDEDDAAQEAMISFMAALDTFEPSRGRFSTYAGTLARWRLLTLRGTTGLISLPCQSNLPYLKPKTMARVQRSRVIASLSAPLPGSDTRVGDLIPDAAADPAAEACRREGARLARAILEKLTERQRTVIERRLDGDTLLEIGLDIGVTRERVRQIEAEAYVRLRKLVGRTSDPGP